MDLDNIVKTLPCKNGGAGRGICRLEYEKLYVEKAIALYVY